MQQVVLTQRHRGGELGARVAAPGVHGHARSHQGWCAIEELPVIAKVHLVAYGLVVEPHVHAAPVEAAEVVQIDAVCGVIHHVHALVGVELEGDVLVAIPGLEQLVALAQGKPQQVVLALVGAGAHLVFVQTVTGASCGGEVLEVAAGMVVVGLSNGAAVGHVEVPAGHGGGKRAGAAVFIAAIEAARLAIEQGLLPWGGKRWLAAFHRDGSTEGIAAHAHRRYPGPYRDSAHLGWVQVGKRRVHVVWAGRTGVHAVHLDVQSVIGHAVDHGKTRDPAIAVAAHARDGTQQGGGIAGSSPGPAHLGLINREAAKGLRAGVFGDDDPRQLGHFRCTTHQWQGQRQQAGPAMAALHQAQAKMSPSNHDHILNSVTPTMARSSRLYRHLPAGQPVVHALGR